MNLITKLTRITGVVLLALTLPATADEGLGAQ